MKPSTSLFALLFGVACFSGGVITGRRTPWNLYHSELKISADLKTRLGNTSALLVGITEEKRMLEYQIHLCQTNFQTILDGLAGQKRTKP